MITDKQFLDIYNLIDKKGSKNPDSLLEFRESPIGNMYVMCIGYDDNFYGFEPSELKLVKYADITKNAEHQEKSTFEHDVDAFGSLDKLMVMPEGFTIFSSTDDTAYIRHTPDLETEPTVVYESSSDTSFFSKSFGIKSYFSGLASYILVGVYGREDSKKDLLLSDDGGKTFKVINQTRNIAGSGRNSHWHDVAIDVYSGFLWAAQGDFSNQRLIFSDDMGETWKTLTEDSHPTAIIPFPDRVIFGRDDGLPGLSYFEKPLTNKDYESIDEKSYKTLREFIPSGKGSNFYGCYPLSQGNEAYLTFAPYSNYNNNFIMGSGDFGKTWHFLLMGDQVASKRQVLNNMWGIDDKYIYGTISSPNPGSTVVYAEKPSWV